MDEASFWLAFAVAERIIRKGPVINYGVCASMLDKAGAHACAALAREMPREDFIGDALRYEFENEWKKFNRRAQV